MSEMVGGEPNGENLSSAERFARTEGMAALEFLLKEHPKKYDNQPLIDIAATAIDRALAVSPHDEINAREATDALLQLLVAEAGLGWGPTSE